RELTIPPPPDPARPGSVQGTLLFAEPGRSTMQPAVDATIELVGSGVSTRSDKEGRFNLRPIAVNSGTVLIRFDSKHDKMVDHQRSYDLEQLGGGVARDVALGPVTLGANAALRGTVLRADSSSTPSGHSGTAVFVPDGP